MNALKTGRVLRIALAASLAVHFIVAALIYARPVTAAPEQKAQRIQILRVQPPTPKPTLPPTPPPKTPPAHTQRLLSVARPAIHVVKLTHSARRSGPPPAVLPIEPTGAPYAVGPAGPPAVAPTSGPPAPTPTPKPACSAPDVPARTLVTQQAIAPEDAAGYTGTAKVRVDLDASGNVVGAGIYTSTGSMQLDRAAVQAARASRYAPEQRDCKNVPGSYLFVVDFE